jgi:hypothetical protein
VDHGSRYWLDYLLYMPSSSVPTTATAISTSDLSVHDTTGTTVIGSSTPAVIPQLPNTASTSRTTQARGPPLLPSSSPDPSGIPPSFGPPPPQSSPIAAAAKAKPSNTAAIVGGVFGSLVLLTAAALLAIFFYRRRRNSQASAISAYSARL